MIAIELKNVTKNFKDLTAVNDLSVKINRGEYVALLGPNGAGKTTLVEMIEGIQKPDKGEIRILGKVWKDSEQELKNKLGFSLQETHFIPKLTVEETIKLFSSFYTKTDRASEILNWTCGKKSNIRRKSFWWTKTKIGIKYCSHPRPRDFNSRRTYNRT